MSVCVCVVILSRAVMLQDDFRGQAGQRVEYRAGGKMKSGGERR